MLALDMPETRQKLPLRIRAPEKTWLRRGVVAACLIPFSGLFGLIALFIYEMGSLRSLWNSVGNEPEFLWLILMPVVLVFSVGTVLTALLAARSVRSQPNIRILRLLWTGLRTAWLIHIFTAFAQFFGLVTFNMTPNTSLTMRPQDFAEFAQIHLVLLIAATMPLALICTYIFRMVALTRKPDQLTSAFD